MKLGCYDELNARSKKFAKKRDFKNSPWRVKDITSKNKNGYITDHKIWCQELFAGRILTASEKIKRHLYAAGFKENKCGMLWNYRMEWQTDKLSTSSP